MKTLVISPTFNERKNIKIFIDTVLNDNPTFDLLIVDDNSPDGTSDKVRELQSKFENLHILLFYLLLFWRWGTRITATSARRA